jgi:hypothetical protein
MSVFKSMGSNSRVQYEKVWLTCERIRLTFGLFSFFPSFMAFSIFCVFLKLLLHTMDEHMHKILIVFVFTMAMHQMIALVFVVQWVTIGQYWIMMTKMLFFMEFVDMASKIHNMWRYERVVGYMKNQLLGSFFEKLFR